MLDTLFANPVLDPARLAALDAYSILDTVPEEGFDDIAQLAALACNTPVALVSLIDRDRQWFKARVNFSACETDLNRSVCQYALVQPDLLIIPDLTADPRTAGNPLVTDDPHIRFYAGAPLRTPEGQVIGSLCVIDKKPRPKGLTSVQAEHLRRCARQVMSLLALRRAVTSRDDVLSRQDLELRRERRLELLATISSTLLTATQPAQVLETVLASEADSLNVDRSYIYEAVAGEGYLRLTHGTGLSDQTRALLQRMEYGTPVCGMIAESRQPLVLNDLQAGTDPCFQAARDDGVNAYAGYPIISRGELRGVVAFGSSRIGTFDQETLDFFTTVARFLSLAQERLDSDAALRTAERRARLAQEAGQVGTFEVDVASGLISVSPEFARLYGVPPAGLYSVERFEALVIPEDRALPSSDATRQAGNAALDVEYRIRRADDGALRWIARRASFVRDAAGLPTSMVGTVQDVTDRHRVQEALEASGTVARENVQRVQLALDAGAIIGTWHWDIPSDRFTVDEAFARTFGLDPALGREGIPLAQIVATVHPDDQAGLATAINEAITRGGAYAHQYRVRRVDGQYYWIEANGRVDHAPDGTPLSFPGVLLDIEERRAAQKALAESEAHWRGLFERLSEGFIVGEVIRDAAGTITDWRYIDVNAAWGALVGIEPASVVGRTLREVLPGIEDEWVQEFAEVVRSGRGTTFTRQVGTLHRWYEGRAFPLGPERFGVIFLDVTERLLGTQRRETLLQLGDRLRELNSKAEIAAAAAEAVGTALGLSRAGYGSVDAVREEVMVEQDWALPGLASIAGLHTFRTYGSYIELLKQGQTVIISDTIHDPLTAANADALLQVQARAFVNLPVMERGRFVGLFFLLAAEPRVWTEPELLFMRTVADRTRAAIAQVEAEEQQDLLNRELSHRLKNTLAVVQSIASQTLRGVTERNLVEAYERRIIALSRAHDVLLEDNYAAAAIKAVVGTVLGLLAPKDRLIIEGEDVGLGPQAALSLSLLLHELATNAGKYGAWSSDTGTVTIRWQVEESSEPTFVLIWQQRGGPPAVEPSRRGFGSRLIRSGLLGTRQTVLHYQDTGFEAEFRASDAQVRSA